MSRIIDIILSVIGLGAFGALFWFAYQRSVDRSVLVVKWLVTIPVILFFWKIVMPACAQGGFSAIFSIFLGLLCGAVLAVLWTGSLLDTVFKPLTSMFDGGSTPPEPKPYYSIAIAKRKRNQPLEAVIAIREELAKFPYDFEGTLLLANIQAEDLKDLPSAEMTLNHFCEWEKAPPKQVAAALVQIADWHLKFYQDATSAGAALQRIIEKYPGSDLALSARERIAHLSGTGKHLLASQDRRPVFVPEGVKNVGLLESSAHLVPTETSPAELASAYVQQLKDHPHDTETREKLAVLYATQYHRLDLATIELEQLIEEPKHAPKRIAHWLNLLADLQVRGGADYEIARATLEKIIDRFPDFGIAEVARNRLAHLKLEYKGQEKTPGKTLGVYEQNIGLKSNRGY
jgi:hypothetical protein